MSCRFASNTCISKENDSVLHDHRTIAAPKKMKSNSMVFIKYVVHIQISPIVSNSSIIAFFFFFSDLGSKVHTSQFVVKSVEYFNLQYPDPTTFLAGTLSR